MDIVDQIRADRENGAICLEREYKSRLMAVAVKLCRDETEAEALVYQAFDEALRRIETLSQPESFYSWLCAILVNCHGMATRRKENSRVSFMDKLPEPPTEDGMDNIVRSVDGAILHEAIDRLPPKLKETVVLRYFMDMPLQQIARFLMIPVGTVNSRLHVARMALSMRLGAKLKKPAVALVAVGLFLLASAAVIGLRNANVLGGTGEAAQETVVNGSTEEMLHENPDVSDSAPVSSGDDANLAPPQQQEKENTEMKTTTIGGIFRKAARAVSTVAMTMLAASATYGDDPYIQGDGTSGISTGYRMKGTSRLEVDFAMVDISDPGTWNECRIFGTDNTAYEPALQTCVYATYTASNDSMYFRVRAKTSASSSRPTKYRSGVDTGRHKVVFDLPNAKMVFMTGTAATGIVTNNYSYSDGGADKTVDAGVSFEGQESTMPLSLFGRWDNAQATKFQNGTQSSDNVKALCAKARIYGVKIYEGDELVRDFVPCLKDGVACFRDLVNGGFIVGENAAAFTAGGDVPTVADDGYVSTAANTDGGKLYFDTGYKTTDKSAVALDCALTVNKNLAGSIWRLFQEGSGNIFDFNLNGNNGLRYQVAGTYKTDFTTAFKDTLYDDKDVRRTFYLDNRGQAAVVTSGHTNQLITFTQSATISHSQTLKLASNWAGSSDFSAIKIYGCKIWEDDVLKRDFAPYVHNGTPGLRDRLTGAFIAASRNSGDTTSALAYGGAIVEDAYLESNGTTGLNTGCRLKGISRLEVDFNLTEAGQNTRRIFGSDTQESTLMTWLGTDSSGYWRMVAKANSVEKGRYPPSTPTACDTTRHTAIMSFDSDNGGTYNYRFVTGNTTNTMTGEFTDVSNIEASMPLALFARYGDSAGTTFHGYTAAKARIYSVRIYESDALVHEFLPYSRDGVVGFYDTVTGDIISNGSSFTFGGRGQDHGQLKAYITPGYNDRIGYSESTTLTAYAPGATSYRWLCDGKPIEGGADGNLAVAWTRGGVSQVPGFKIHTYQAVAVFEDFSGATRESAPSAAADVKCRQLGTTFMIK